MQCSKVVCSKEDNEQNRKMVCNNEGDTPFRKLYAMRISATQEMVSNKENGV